MEDLDMIYNVSEGKTMAGGYSVNSVLLNQQQPAIYNDAIYNDTQSQEGGKNKHTKVSERFKHLAIPAGLLYIRESMSDNAYKQVNNASTGINASTDPIVNDQLYEKLLHLAEIEPTVKKQTRSKKSKRKHDKPKNTHKKNLTKKHNIKH